MALKVTNLFSLGLMFWSYGLFPHMCAALLTSQVAFSTKAYLSRAGMKYATHRDSPQKYQGTNMGTKKHMSSTESL